MNIDGPFRQPATPISAVNRGHQVLNAALARVATVGYQNACVRRRIAGSEMLKEDAVGDREADQSVDLRQRLTLLHENSENAVSRWAAKNHLEILDPVAVASISVEVAIWA